MWIAIHFYHDNKSLDLLCNLIDPLSKKVIKARLSDQFFFVNYFDDIGPHIRLRFRISANEKKIVVLSKIKELIESLIHAGLPLRLYRFMDYEQEVDRYGGLPSIAIAERHFHSSSQTVLALINNGKEKFLSQSITNALDMHFSFLHSLPLNKHEVERILIRILNHWMHSAVQYHRVIIPSQTDETEILSNLGLAFANSFHKQEVAIVEHCRVLWQALERQKRLRKPLENWSNEVKNTHNTLLSSLSQTTFSDNSVTELERAMVIYESYIHMTNNRLGISNTDEAFIAHILLEVWRTLTKTRLS